MEKNREAQNKKRKERDKRYYEAHKEKILAASKKYLKQWIKENQEKWKGYRKKYNAKIREERSEEYLTIAGVAEALGLTVAKVKELLDKGLMPFIRPEKDRLVPRSFVESILQGECNEE